MSQLSQAWYLLVLPLVLTSHMALAFTPSGNISTDPQAKMVSRIRNLELPLTPTASDAHLRSKITDYLKTGSRSTERMLGRALEYFPVFEYYLDKHDMPASLKYLAVAESMLMQGAVSHARAAGLWQLMPATAREMGLRVDGVVDERLDVHRSTEAAVLMLKDLYAQFGDWHLALAAYNCGPGRVRRAVRAAGGYTKYAKVKRYLPRESQKYVAAYVAAAYALNYYSDYGLTPSEDDGIAEVRVRSKLNLRRLARDNEGLSYRTLRKLNPSFVVGVVPASERGYLVRIPTDFKYALQQTIWERPNLVAYPADADIEQARQFASIEGFSPLSMAFGCNPENIHYQTTNYELERFVDALSLAFYNDYEAIAMTAIMPVYTNQLPQAK